MTTASLLDQAVAAMSRGNAEFGRSAHQADYKVAVASASLAAQHGYARIDDIVFNDATAQMAAGERFFVLQGDRFDPAHLRESMSTDAALAMTSNEMEAKIAQLSAPLPGQDQLQCTAPSGPQLT